MTGLSFAFTANRGESNKSKGRKARAWVFIAVIIVTATVMWSF